MGAKHGLIGLDKIKSYGLSGMESTNLTASSANETKNLLLPHLENVESSV